MPDHRRGRIVLAAFVAVLMGWTAPGFSGEGEDLPTPPRQADPWSPPATSLPGFLVSATRTLFDQGLADPRGCDYRAIEVRASDLWMPGIGNARTHGWVLPREEGRREDFAVCWNGLVYPVAVLGEKADLDADLRALVDSLKAEREKARNSGPGSAFGGFMGGDGAIAEGLAVDVGQPIPIKLCLLLRLGRADLAESLFAACTIWKPDGPRRDLTDYGISYLTLASDWAWFLFDRAIGAHMRGDDRIALADSKRLTEVSEKIEARAAAMGFGRPLRMFNHRASHPYLGFLGQLDTLRQDQERRAREPRRGDADAATRIAGLIRDLDQIAVRQNAQPGWLDLSLAPAVQALIAEGDAAVEPLLVVLESDMRLTRSIAFGRREDRGRTVLGVHDAAYKALRGILRTANLGEGPVPVLGPYGDPEVRRKQAGSIRAYWAKNKGVSPVERCYRTLRDDAATTAQWQEAGTQLVQPANAPGRVIHAPGLPPTKPADAIAMKGATLRDGRDPSVSELLAQRALELARPGREARPGESDPLNGASNLALVLHCWDPLGSRPVLTTVMNRCQNELLDRAARHTTAQRLKLLNALPRLADALAASGDLAALDRAAAIVPTLTAQDILIAPGSLLQLMADHPNHRAIAAAADWFFNDPRSPWVAQLYRSHCELLGNPGYLWPGSLGVAAFRKRLGILLEDETVIGSIVFRVADNRRTFEIRWKDQPAREKPGADSESEFRACDYVAWQLKMHGLAVMPRFHLEWPLERRNEAIAGCREALKRLDR
jgi:hypothetical protein